MNASLDIYNWVKCHLHAGESRQGRKKIVPAIADKLNELLDALKRR